MGSEQRKDRPAKRGVVRALFGPVNLSVAAVASGAAAALHSLPVLAAGAAAYLTLVAWDLTNDGKRGRGGGTALPRLHPRDIQDTELKKVYTRIQTARATVDRVLQEVPGSVAAHILPSLGSLEEIEVRAGHLAAQGDELARHLAATDAEALRKESYSFGARALAARDEEARRQYQEAQISREEQLRVLGELDAGRDRVMASLTRILAALEGLPTKVVKMRALDAQTVDDLSGDVGRELDRINVEVGALEETLAALVEAQRA